MSTIATIHLMNSLKNTPILSVNCDRSTIEVSASRSMIFIKLNLSAGSIKSNRGSMMVILNVLTNWKVTIDPITAIVRNFSLIRNLITLSYC
jgi:hypothetical protein